MPTPDQLYNEANALKTQGDLEGAVAKLREILAIDEKHTLSHMALAINLQRLGQFDESIRHALRAVELEPNDPFSYTQLSVIYQRCGRIPEAEDAKARAQMLQMGHVGH